MKPCVLILLIFHIEKGVELSYGFDSFCKEYNIYGQLTIRWTLEKNGNKRKITIVIEIAHNMISENHLSNDVGSKL